MGAQRGEGGQWPSLRGVMRVQREDGGITIFLVV